jgi:hypothetical protein
LALPFSSTFWLAENVETHGLAHGARRIAVQTKPAGGVAAAMAQVPVVKLVELVRRKGSEVALVVEVLIPPMLSFQWGMA